MFAVINGLCGISNNILYIVSYETYIIMLILCFVSKYGRITGDF